jgi:hypothetical protein
MHKPLIVLVFLAITLVSCGPSKAELAAQTQAAATVSAASWTSTQQYIERVQQDLLDMCADIDLSTIATSAPPESPGVIWFVEIFPLGDLELSEYEYPNEYAVLLPGGEHDYMASVTSATTLLCVHRLRIKHDECVFDMDEFLRPMDPKTLQRYRVDTNVYLIDLTTSRLFASIEWPSGQTRCPDSHRFSADEKTDIGYFGAVDLSLIFEFAARIWQQ